MKTFTYNDMEFSLAHAGNAWNISRELPNGESTVIGAGLYADQADKDAEACALAFVRAIFPVGIMLVVPDVAHPHRVGELNIIGPDVSHPHFIYWDKDSTSFAR